MNITELENQNERQAEGFINNRDPAVQKSLTHEKPTVIGKEIQQDSHETGLEHQSTTPLKDVVVSLTIILSFAALIYFVYLAYPS